MHLARPTSTCCAKPSMIHGEEDPGGLLWRRQVQQHYGAGQVLSSGMGGMYSASEVLSFEADIKTIQCDISLEINLAEGTAYSVTRYVGSMVFSCSRVFNHLLGIARSPPLFYCFRWSSMLRVARTTSILHSRCICTMRPPGPQLKLAHRSAPKADLPIRKFNQRQAGLVKS